MRPPRLGLGQFSRGLEKLRPWTRRPGHSKALPANLPLCNPRMLPWFRPGIARSINRELLQRQLIPFVKSLPAPVIAVTTLPIVADLVGALPVERWVYYCVDDFGQWPGLDRQTLQRMDNRL